MRVPTNRRPPVKVLLIAPPIRVTGGQAVQAQRLLAGFSSNPLVDVTFLPTISVLQLFGIDFGRLPYFRTIANSIAYVYQLIRRAFSHDIVHVFSAGYSSFLLIAVPALLISRILKKQSILHYHDGRAKQHLEQWTGTVALCKLADVIVTPSSFLVGVFARFGLPAYSIPNVLNSEQYPFRLRKQIRPLFFHNRGLEKEYNVRCTLLAFSIIQDKYPHAQLLIAHDGSYRAQLEHLSKSLKLRNITFTGAVKQKQILDLYNDFDIYLTSADYDNFPGSILEAFACGLPVVSTSAGGTSWIVRDRQNGLLVECGDHTAMAHAAFRLLEEPGLGESLSQAARRDLPAYAWENIEWQWLDLYSRLAGNCDLAQSSSAAIPEREWSNK